MKRVVERRQRAVERTREDILEAAARALARTGYQSVTMRDIAREAGYTAAALYTYFENKQEILAALVKLVIDEYLEVVGEPMPPGLDFRQRVERLLQLVLAQTERRRDFFLLVSSMAQANQHPRPARQQPDPIKSMQKAQARLVRWFAENAGPRHLGGHSPEDVARFFSGITQSFMSEWIVLDPTPGELIRRVPLILDLFLNGVSGVRKTRRQKTGADA